MPFIGNQPALSYTSFAKQDFTTSATTSYTLDNPVANANELALFINFVRQEPTTAYTASGTSLTLTSATSASDDMYCVFLGKAVQTVNPPNGSVGLSQLSATGTKDSTTFLRGDNTFASAGGTTAPYISVYRNGDQTFSGSTWTKIQFNAEHIDSGGVFDSTTNNRFTPTTSGYYFVAVNLGVGITADNAIDQLRVEIYKNGSAITATKTVRDWDTTGINFNDQINTSTIVQLNGSTDYIEGYAYMVISSGTPRIENSQATMQIFKMTE